MGRLLRAAEDAGKPVPGDLATTLVAKAIDRKM
jgi:hypothetical protein